MELPAALVGVTVHLENQLKTYTAGSGYMVISRHSDLRSAKGPLKRDLKRVKKAVKFCRSSFPSSISCGG